MCAIARSHSAALATDSHSAPSDSSQWTSDDGCDRFVSWQRLYVSRAACERYLQAAAICMNLSDLHSDWDLVQKWAPVARDLGFDELALAIRLTEEGNSWQWKGYAPYKEVVIPLLTKLREEAVNQAVVDQYLAGLCEVLKGEHGHKEDARELLRRAIDAKK